MPEEQKNSAEAANALIGAVIVAAAVCLPWLLDRASQLRRFQHINNQSSGGERSGEYEGKSPLQPERDRQDQNRDRASPIKDWQRDNSEKMVRFNKGLLGATVGLVILGGLQFWATYVSQRAFLHLESLSLNTNTLIAGASPTAQAGIKKQREKYGLCHRWKCQLELRVSRHSAP
jgi:hypothetical protein